MVLIWYTLQSWLDRFYLMPLVLVCHIYIIEVLCGTCNSNYIIPFVCLPAIWKLFIALLLLLTHRKWRIEKKNKTNEANFQIAYTAYSLMLYWCTLQSTTVVCDNGGVCFVTNHHMILEGTRCDSKQSNMIM